MSRYHSLMAKIAPDIDQERLPSLVLKLEAAIIKKLDKLPSTAPVAGQMIESLSSIKADLESKMGLVGREAIEAFLRAVEDHFLPDFPPLKAWMRKYPEIVIDRFTGNMSLAAPAELPADSETT